ncbi:DUF5684 domain-containing protein [Microbacterium sp. A82]|uniref:DUF5684 domain-containing protein n=1 Tax=unclassified Microbacterium TaxID=2609290 RepID=UPI003F34A360
MDSNLVTEQLFSTSSVLLGIVVYVIYAITMWKVFAKADYPGILALIPIVNWIILVKIAGMSGWFVLLYLIPIVNIVFAIVVAFKEGANFGKGGVFSFFLLWMFPFIGHLIIGFGSAKYRRV